MVGDFAFGTWHHGHWVNAVVFVEAPCSPAHAGLHGLLIHPHRVVVGLLEGLVSNSVVAGSEG